MKKIALVVAMGFASMGAQAAAISGLYNTGAGFAANTQDTHYALSSTTASAGSLGAYGYVSENGAFPIGPWMANDSTSSWLTPVDNQDRSFDASRDGTYTWTTTFDLSGFDASTATFTGRFAADNSAIALLNGNQIGSSNGFTTFSAFTADSSKFISGVNTLSFVVTNLRGTGNPTGLRVEFLTSNVTAVPEADTYAMMFAGLGLMGLIARRKKAV